MTEKEKLQRAKKYIDYLSRGFNPLDGSRIKNDDVVRNERISRCLMYVSEVLGEVIDKGLGKEREFTYKKPERVKKEEFYLSEDERKAFILSDKPLTSSEIAIGLSSIRDRERYRDIKGASINEWLMQMGFLCQERTPSGRTGYMVTDEGLAIGITAEKRLSQLNVPYYVMKFSKAAQQFILDNLDAIIDHNRARKIMQKAKREERKSAKKYGSSSIADEIIADLHSAGATVDDIVYSTDLDKDTVLERMRAMKLI